MAKGEHGKTFFARDSDNEHGAHKGDELHETHDLAEGDGINEWSFDKNREQHARPDIAPVAATPTRQGPIREAVG